MYIRRFESISIDNGMESCKDLIECLDDFEEGIKAVNYKVGYYDTYYSSSEIFDTSKSGKSKRAVSFIIEVKDFDGDINDKSGFDKIILLTQRCKYLYSKFENYCDDIIVDILGNNEIKFILLFEHKDESEKLESKIKRVVGIIETYFDDWVKKRTFFFDRFKGDKHSSILKEIQKIGPVDGNDNPADSILSSRGYTSIEFRFGVDVTRDVDVITLTPINFKWKTNDIKWKKMKPTLDVMNNISKEIISGLQDNYRLSDESIPKSNYSIENGIVKIKID